MKKILILAASPRKNGNTNAFVKVVTETFNGYDGLGESFEYETVQLYDLDIKPCIACRCCQTDWTEAYCVQEDDCTASLIDKIAGSDILVFATPIYSWYCTAPMKALLDRCVYAFNKYYDDAVATHKGERGPALWAGKKVALITTCGYPPEKGMDLLEEGIRRYCKHSQLEYIGSLVGRHDGYTKDFLDDTKIANAKAFAERIIGDER